MITQKELKEVMYYDPTTGVFTRLAPRTGPMQGNTTVGTLNKPGGYMCMSVKGKRHLAHRLAWIYMMGFDAEYQVDHKDGDKLNNRWSNLRHVTNACNMQNQKTRSTNTSGFTGVCWSKRQLMWSSTIYINGSSKHLGYHDSALEAALARVTIEVQCSKWTCNYRSELVKAIQKEWPDFKLKQ